MTVTIAAWGAPPAQADGADTGIALEMEAPTIYDNELHFKVVHPQRSSEVRLIVDSTVDSTTQPAVDSIESTFTVEADSKSHEYRAIVYGSDGIELGESSIMVVDGAQYQPSSPTWDLKTGETVLTGRMNISGKVDGNTSSVFLAINGKLAYKTTPVGGSYSFKKVALPKQYNWVQVIAKNEWGQATTKSAQVDYFNIKPKLKNYVVVDKSELCLYYIEDNEISDIYPIAIGTPRTPTLEGTFVVTNKLVTSPGGDWGARRIVLFTRGIDSVYRYTGYNIHGTNQPASIGKMASHGCVRMFNEDAITLYNRVSKGFEVFIVS
jgi:lipoprotein-anchoring transpeptidase ErfK/SrfK